METMKSIDKISYVRTDGRTCYKYRCFCPSCGKDRGYKEPRRMNRLCKSCSAQSMSQATKNKISSTRKGIEPWNKGTGSTPSTKKERTVFHHQKLHTQCFEKANFTCNICKQRGGKLNAHHLDSWKSYPEKRFDLNNLVCLCEKCHKEFHAKYGFKNNTKEQFDEFSKSNIII